MSVSEDGEYEYYYEYYYDYEDDDDVKQQQHQQPPSSSRTKPLKSIGDYDLTRFTADKVGETGDGLHDAHARDTHSISR